jgi:general stress protein 26
MNSINQQQEEQNTKNLNGQEAVSKIKELVKKTSTCFFCSDIKTGVPLSVRPMTIQKVEDDGSLWFLSADDSRKDQEIHTDLFVQLLFQGSAHSDFLSIYGIASSNKDKGKIKEMWEPIMKTWFTDGEDDPRITVIKVEPSEAYYWDNKHGNAIAFLKMVIGSVTGKTLDDSIEGKLEV